MPPKHSRRDRVAYAIRARRPEQRCFGGMGTSAATELVRTGPGCGFPPPKAEAPSLTKSALGSVGKSDTGLLRSQVAAGPATDDDPKLHGGGVHPMLFGYVSTLVLPGIYGRPAF